MARGAEDQWLRTGSGTMRRAVVVICCNYYRAPPQYGLGSESTCVVPVAVSCSVGKQASSVGVEVRERGGSRLKGAGKCTRWIDAGQPD